MRRGLIRTTLSILVAVLPMLVGVGSAAAQQLNKYPGSIVDIKSTTVTIANTVAQTSMYSITIPPRYFKVNAQPLLGGAALHLVLMGTITTNQGAGSVGNINVGCNFGGTTASIALVNAQAPQASLVAQPFNMDVWVRAQGTSTASEFLMGRLEIAPTQVLNASTSTYNAAVTGTTSLTANQTLACAWGWGSAATTNSLTINSAVLSVGE